MAWFWDVSNHQGTTPSLKDWDGLIVKASEGSGFRDPRFWQHINVAREAGKIHAGYHFLRSDSPVKDQVATFTSVCPKEIAAVPDVESIKDRNGKIVSAPTLAQTREFVARLQDLGYYVPMQYLPRWYWNFWGQPDLSGLPPIWGSYYPDYVARPREQAWAMIPESAKQGFGGLPMVALQFTSSPLDQNHSEHTAEDFYNFLSTTRRVPMPLTQADADLVVETLLNYVVRDEREEKPDGTHDSSVRNMIWSAWHTMHFGDAVNGNYPSNKNILDAVEKHTGVKLSPEDHEALGKIIKQSMSEVAQSSFQMALRGMEGTLTGAPGKIGFAPKPVGQ